MTLLGILLGAAPARLLGKPLPMPQMLVPKSSDAAIP